MEVNPVKVFIGRTGVLRAAWFGWASIFLLMAVAVGAQEKTLTPKGEKAAEKPVPNTVFQCRHEGVIVFTNTRLNKACRATVLGPMPAVATPSAAPGAAAGQSAAFPKVTEATQKARDGDRKRILEEELASEQKQIDAARKDLEVQTKAAQEEKNYQKIIERLQPYKEKIAQHERNLQALKKEIAALPKS